MKVFSEWRSARDGDEKCPSDLFENPTTGYWLPRFINEVRRTDGEPYPPRTINQILAGLQRYMLDNDYCFLIGKIHNSGQFTELVIMSTILYTHKEWVLAYDQLL